MVWWTSHDERVDTMSSWSAARVPERRLLPRELPNVVALPANRRPSVVGWARSTDRRVAEALRPVALPSLRILLGLLFVWFGGLKVVGASPVEALVAGTLPWFDPRLSMLALGGTEVALGLGLVVGFAVRLVLPVLAAHLGGTFLAFLMLPDLMFRQNNPLLLTESGEFVAKNLVLIAATVVLIAHTRNESRVSSERYAHAANPAAAA